MVVATVQVMEYNARNRSSSKDTAEYKVIQEFFHQLVDHSKTNIPTLCNKLFSIKLLTQHEYDNLLESHKGPYEKATNLIRIILLNVENDISSLSEFLSVLRQCELEQVAGDLESSLGHKKLSSTVPASNLSQSTSVDDVYSNISKAEKSDPVAYYDLSGRSSGTNSDVFFTPRGQEHFKASHPSGVSSELLDSSMLDSGVLPEGRNDFDRPLKYPTQAENHNSDMVTKQQSRPVFHSHHQENVYPNPKRPPTSQSSSYRSIPIFPTTNTPRTNCPEAPCVSSASYKAPGTLRMPVMDSSFNSPRYADPCSAPSAPDTYGSTTSYISRDFREARHFDSASTSAIESEIAYYKKEAAHREDENKHLKGIIDKRNQELTFMIQGWQEKFIQQHETAQALRNQLRDLMTSLVDAKHSESIAAKRAMEIEKDMEESTTQYKEHIEALSLQLRDTKEKRVYLCSVVAWDQLLSEKEARKRDKIGMGRAIRNVRVRAAEVDVTRSWSSGVGHMNAQDDALPVQHANNDLLKRLESLDLNSDRL